MNTQEEDGNTEQFTVVTDSVDDLSSLLVLAVNNLWKKFPNSDKDRFVVTVEIYPEKEEENA